MILFYNEFQGFKVLRKGLFTSSSSLVCCIWFPSNELFMGFYIAQFFQMSQVCCQITICYLQQLFERTEFKMLMNSQYRHNLKSDLAFKSFVVMF